MGETNRAEERGGTMGPSPSAKSLNGSASNIRPGDSGGDGSAGVSGSAVTGGRTGAGTPWGSGHRL